MSHFEAFEWIGSSKKFGCKKGIGRKRNFEQKIDKRSQWNERERKRDCGKFFYCFLKTYILNLMKLLKNLIWLYNYYYY